MVFPLFSKKAIFPLSLSTLLVVLVLMSLALMFGSYLQPLGENWSHLIEYLLTSILMDTLLLLVLNLFGCFVLGVTLAWLVCRYEFYGRRWFQWMFVLPLCTPPYVTAFVLFDVFDSSGTLNHRINDFWGITMSLDLQYLGYASLTMIMVFYPYVYWVVRSALLSIRGNVVDSSYSLGMGEFGLFWRVIMPIIKPAIMAGLSLVMLETLADFGTVSIFNIDTLTTLIYKVWFSFFDLQSALQISGLLLLFVLAFYSLSQLLKRRGLTHNARQGSVLIRVHLCSWKRWLMSVFCGLVLLLSFLLPVLALAWMAGVSLHHIIWGNFIEVLYNTLVIGSSVSLLLVGVSVLLVVFWHQLRHDHSCCSHRWTSRLIHRWCACLRLGYAFPGSVVAISLIGATVYVDDIATMLGLGSILVGGSLLFLCWAYMIRFFTVSLNVLDGSIHSVNSTLLAIAMNLGLNQWQICQRVYLPNLKIPILSALVLAFIEIIKEMPATLMLSPAEWETFAVTIYNYTSEGEWLHAAMPALAMVVLCIAFMIGSLIFIHAPIKKAKKSPSSG